MNVSGECGVGGCMGMVVGVVAGWGGGVGAGWV